MEQFLDDQRVLKHEVYELFRQAGAPQQQWGPAVGHRGRRGVDPTFFASQPSLLRGLMRWRTPSSEL